MAFWNVLKYQFSNMFSIPATIYCGALFVIGLTWWVWRAVAVKSLMKNLPGPPCGSWLLGNLADLNELSFNHEIIQKYGSLAKVHGLCGDEQIYISDPLALRAILINNYSSFAETRLFVTLNRLKFGAAMTTVHEDQHKRFRKLLNPLFSASNTRALVPIISETVLRAAEILRTDILHNGTNINMSHTISHITLEALGQALFDHSFNILEDSNSPSRLVKLIFPSLEKLGVLVLCLPFLIKIGSSTFRRRVVNLVPSRRVQAFKAVVDAVTRLGNDVISSRQADLIAEGCTLSDGTKKGKDIVSLLFQANTSTLTGDHLSEDDVASQIRLFILAGSDTTSVVLCRAFEELAQHLEVQETLRKEVLQLNRESLSYDAIKRLPYLHAVVQETLRVHPSVVKLERTTLKDIVIPLYVPVPGTDGKMISEVVVAKNQTVILGVANCNRDITIWGDDAAEWKPERWLAPLPDSLAKAQIPGVFPNLMTFLGGDRSCIGYNFALMEMKVILSIFISQFKFNIPDHDKVKWKIGGTQYPVVLGKGLGLPLIVTPIEPMHHTSPK